MKYTYINQQHHDFGSTLLGQIGGGIGSALSGGLGGLMGMMFQGEQNQNQLNQQQALTNMQEQANEKLSAFNFNQQFDLWNKTNYPAQVDQLNKAGLNPALLYGKSGGGGTTTGTPSGGIGMGIAPSGNPVQQMMQNTIAGQEAAADIKLKNAQADNIAAKTPQEAGLMTATIDSINQGVNNQKAQEALTDAQAQTARIANSIQGETIDDQIATIRATAGQIQNEMQRTVRQNNMDAATYNDKISTIHGIMIGTFINNNLQKAQTNQAQAATTNIQQQTTQSIQTIAQQWKQLGINQQNANTQESQMKIQKFVNDITHGQQILEQGLTRLIPNLIF